MGRRAVAFVVAAVGVLGLAIGAAAARWPEPAPPRIGPGVTLTVDPEALARVDLAQVHEELIPDWTAATGGLRTLHLERLRRAVAPDPNLLGLLDRVAELEGDPVAHAPELHALLRAWNELLRKAGEPWRLGGEVIVGDGGRFVVKSYRAVTGSGVAGEGTAEPAVTLGGERYPVEIRRRVDALATSDNWLGRMHDHEDGIVILLDRVTSFALDDVWPLLDPELPLTGPQRAWAGPVRAELARHLSEDELSTLSATAADRYWLVAATADIHGRHACGSSFTVSKLAWNGFDVRDLTVLQRHAELGGPCPDVLPDEALLFATRSWHLRHTPGVREALEHLVAVVAEGVAVHEAQHAADDRALDGQRIACIGCPAETSHVGALEASAYAASFADEDHGAMALFQACRVRSEASEDVKGAIGFLAERLAPAACDDGPPADLPARARRLERDVFLRDGEAARLDFPAGLPVSSAYRGR